MNNKIKKLLEEKRLDLAVYPLTNKDLLKAVLPLLKQISKLDVYDLYGFIDYLQNLVKEK